MNMIKGKKVELPSITGTTAINHATRVYLGLTPSEYILMDYIFRKVEKKEELNFLSTYKATGFKTETQEIVYRNLMAKGFIYPENCNPPKLTDKWRSAFTDIEKEFELFWKIDGVVFWTGSKKQACRKYVELRKEYSKDFLMMQRNSYARYLRLENENGFDRRVMMAERWLAKANEYYEVDWKKMGDEIEMKIKAKAKPNATEKTETLTAEERIKQYEEDSNK